MTEPQIFVLGTSTVGVVLWDATDCAPRTQLQRTAAIATARRLTGNDECTIEHDEHGAPRLAGACGYISVSHCAVGVAVALNLECPIGIDFETGRYGQLRRVAPRFVSEGERLRSCAPLPDATLLALWTAKEAVYKAMHTPGLPLTSIDVHKNKATAPGRSFALYYREIADAQIVVAETDQSSLPANSIR